MKKRVIGFGVAIFISILLGGCSNKANNAESSSVKSSKTLISKTKVSANDAIKVYQKTYPDTSVTSLELEKSLRGPVYKVEGIDDQKEYQVNINAKNKKILQNSQEELDEDDQNESDRKADTLDLSNLISVKKAARIAEKKVKGGKSTEFSLDKDLGTTYWDVTVKKGSQEKNIKINANNGKVLQVEND